MQDPITTPQQELFGPEITGAAERSLLDQLLDDSRLYRTGTDFQGLLDFVARLRNFAPFNAMLLQLQKPGLSYAASARDWRERFGRYPKEDARPLLILWPFGPVALVYDVLDTDGSPLPQGVLHFTANGPIVDARFYQFEMLLKKKGVNIGWVDEGDLQAGRISVVRRATNDKELTNYALKINRNHGAAAKFVTLCHELAHLTLGHLGADKKIRIPDRSNLKHAEEELEAESVAYLVCARNDIQSDSQKYLASYVSDNTSVANLGV